MAVTSDGRVVNARCPNRDCAKPWTWKEVKEMQCDKCGWNLKTPTPEQNYMTYFHTIVADEYPANTGDTQQFHAHCYCRTTTGGTNFCCGCGIAEPYKEPLEYLDTYESPWGWMT